MAPSPLKDLQGKGLRLYWGQLTLHAFVLNPNNYNTIKPWNIFGPMFYLSSNWALLKLTKKGEITEIALMTLQCFFFSAQWMETKLMGMIGYPLKGIFHPKTGWPTSHFFSGTVTYFSTIFNDQTCYEKKSCFVPYFIYRASSNLLSCGKSLIKGSQLYQSKFCRTK